MIAIEAGGALLTLSAITKMATDFLSLLAQPWVGDYTAPTQQQVPAVLRKLSSTTRNMRTVLPAAAHMVMDIIGKAPGGMITITTTPMTSIMNERIALIGEGGQAKVMGAEALARIPIMSMRRK